MHGGVTAAGASCDPEGHMEIFFGILTSFSGGWRIMHSQDGGPCGEVETQSPSTYDNMLA